MREFFRILVDMTGLTLVERDVIDTKDFVRAENCGIAAVPYAPHHRRHNGPDISFREVVIA